MPWITFVETHEALTSFYKKNGRNQTKTLFNFIYRSGSGGGWEVLN